MAFSRLAGYRSKITHQDPLDKPPSRELLSEDKSHVQIFPVEVEIRWDFDFNVRRIAESDAGLNAVNVCNMIRCSLEKNISQQAKAPWKLMSRLASMLIYMRREPKEFQVMDPRESHYTVEPQTWAVGQVLPGTTKISKPLGRPTSEHPTTAVDVMSKEGVRSLIRSSRMSRYRSRGVTKVSLYSRAGWERPTIVINGAKEMIRTDKRVMVSAFSVTIQQTARARRDQELMQVSEDKAIISHPSFRRADTPCEDVLSCLGLCRGVEKVDEDFSVPVMDLSAETLRVMSYRNRYGPGAQEIYTIIEGVADRNEGIINQSYDLYSPPHLKVYPDFTRDETSSNSSKAMSEESDKPGPSCPEDDLESLDSLNLKVHPGAKVDTMSVASFITDEPPPYESAKKFKAVDWSKYPRVVAGSIRDRMAKPTEPSLVEKPKSSLTMKRANSKNYNNKPNKVSWGDGYSLLKKQQ